MAKIIFNGTSSDFCLSNLVCFHEMESINIEEVGKIELPICQIYNSCIYHGQRINDGRYICDYLLNKQNKVKKELLLSKKEG